MRDTLKEHLTRIAIKRQKDLKEKLGKEGVSKMMKLVRAGKPINLTKLK